MGALDGGEPLEETQFGVGLGDAARVMERIRQRADVRLDLLDRRLQIVRRQQSLDDDEPVVLVEAKLVLCQRHQCFPRNNPFSAGKRHPPLRAAFAYPRNLCILPQVHTPASRPGRARVGHTPRRAAR